MVVSRKCDTSYGEEFHNGRLHWRYQIEIQRVNVVSSKPFEAVVEALKAAVGRPDMIEFTNASKRTQTFTELKSVVQRNLGKADLIDHRSNKWPSVTRSTFRAQVGAVWCEG